MDEKGNQKNPVTPFAVTNYRDIRKVFGIKEKNRRGHMYVIGKTGTGKSTLLLNMMVSDIRDGNGLALIDPAGDLAEAVLEYIPKHRINDVIYFNPGDTEYPVGFNPLQRTKKGQDHLVASGLISVFKKIWWEFWGPRMEHILRNAILGLLDYPGSTLLDLPPMLTDKEFRKRVVECIKNPEVRRFWVDEFERYSAWLKSEATAPILTRVGQYLSTPMFRNILGQPQSAFNLREVMNQKKILIVNLSKGTIGEDNCSLLGAMIVTMIQLAALSRNDLPIDKRIPFYLYVDEIHSFATTSFADILSEARKYGLCLIMAHQYLGQLDENVRLAVFGNVGTMITFRIGQEDAWILKREFSPDFNEVNLVNLPNHHIYLRLLIDGVTSRAFSAVTLQPPEMGGSHKMEVVRKSKGKYAKHRTMVEKDLFLMENEGRRDMPRQQRLLL